MIIRTIKMSDAEKLANLIVEVEQSSQYMLLEPGERENSADKQLKMIKSVQDSNNSTILVAEENQQLLGYLFAFGGNSRRNRHIVYIVVGVLAGYRGQGIGSKLFNQLDQWARLQNIRRMELTVATSNRSAVELYKKIGFEIEGTKRKALLVEGEYLDEYYMAKLL
ncbi:GNAT family N-acetyltransferase [Gracilibacillus thailandensis]|uniref:GNAT family N-acetyltransferase n=1 Tax=Gracilibacillus thailandensis TaxID=563735 RepID=A0A6N7R2K7_9BACI|nr:GNAT family N-acetyltransferase [Gracilibacillus thailandensis]MRI65276.1 GNAT family N-acetyltransferase [Gracilibacillus thailandensis]